MLFFTFTIQYYHFYRKIPFRIDNNKIKSVFFILMRRPEHVSTIFILNFVIALFIEIDFCFVLPFFSQCKIGECIIRPWLETGDNKEIKTTATEKNGILINETKAPITKNANRIWTTNQTIWMNFIKKKQTKNEREQTTDLFNERTLRMYNLYTASNQVAYKNQTKPLLYYKNETKIMINKLKLNSSKYCNQLFYTEPAWRCTVHSIQYFDE